MGSMSLLLSVLECREGLPLERLLRLLCRFANDDTRSELDFLCAGRVDEPSPLQRLSLEDRREGLFEPLL